MQPRFCKDSFFATAFFILLTIFFARPHCFLQLFFAALPGKGGLEGEARGATRANLTTARTPQRVPTALGRPWPTAQLAVHRTDLGDEPSRCERASNRRAAGGWVILHNS